MTSNEIANSIELRKRPSGQPSDFDITIQHFKNEQGQGQSDLRIRFAHHAEPSTITLETTPEYDSSQAIKRWAGVLNALNVKAVPTGRNITLMDLHMFDNGQKVVDKSYDGFENSANNTSHSRAAFLEHARDYLLTQAGRPVQPRRLPKRMDKHNRDFKGLTA